MTNLWYHDPEIQRVRLKPMAPMAMSTVCQLAIRYEILELLKTIYNMADSFSFY